MGIIISVLVLFGILWFLKKSDVDTVTPEKVTKNQIEKLLNDLLSEVQKLNDKVSFLEAQLGYKIDENSIEVTSQEGKFMEGVSSEIEQEPEIIESTEGICFKQAEINLFHKFWCNFAFGIIILPKIQCSH